MKQVEKNFRKLAVAFEKINETIKPMSENDRAMYFVRLRGMYRNFVREHDVFKLTKRDLALLFDIQTNHRPMSTDVFMEWVSANAFATVEID